MEPWWEGGEDDEGEEFEDGRDEEGDEVIGLVVVNWREQVVRREKELFDKLKMDDTYRKLCTPPPPLDARTTMVQHQLSNEQIARIYESQMVT